MKPFLTSLHEYGCLKCSEIRALFSQIHMIQAKFSFLIFFFFLHLILNDKIIVFEKDRMEKGKELLPLTSKTLELTLFISVLVYCFIFLIKNCMVFSFTFRTDTLGKHLQLMWFSLMHWWVLTFQFSKLLFYDLKHFLLTTHVQ